VLVVPIAKDTIKTKDGATYKVVEYTNYKEGGPAVYARSPAKENVLVYFIDIAEINGTKVEFQRGSKVFQALGKVSRSQPLPQPDDKIVVAVDTVSSDEDKKDQAEVEGLRLKSKAMGVNKGMFVKAADGTSYRLKQIIDVVPSLGTHTFNRAEFMAAYKDYAGV